jgi:beta-glucosidase
MAKECLVLLKNENVLPVSMQKTKRIVVFGQSANVVPVGDNYSGPFGGWSAGDALTPMQAIEKYCGENVEVVFGNEENVESLCKTCDLAIYFTSTVEGEGMDRCDIRLPNITRKTQQDEGAIIVDKRTIEIVENQEELILKIAKNSPKSVVVLLNGAPVDISAWVDEVGAVVEAWYPGEQGSRAIIGTLFGEFSPSGKLPITFARSVGQLPLYYAHTPSGRGYGYNENDGSPLYPFGYGLSYTRFAVRESNLITDGESLRVVGEIENVGDMDGAEVLQVYISGRNCDVVRPVKQLAGYKRVMVNRGEKAQFDILLDKESFHFYNSKMTYGRHDCDYTVLLATSSQNTLNEYEIRLRSGKVQIANEV